MHPNQRQPIAERMRLLLMQQVGHAIDVERLQTEARYARDVLLVCDAFPGTELAQLARQFRTLGVSGRPRPPLTLPTAAASATPTWEPPGHSGPDTTRPRRIDIARLMPDASGRPAPTAIERIEPELGAVGGPVTRPGTHDLGLRPGPANAEKAPAPTGSTAKAASTRRAADSTARPLPPLPAKRSRFGITLFGPSQFLNSLFGATRFGRRSTPETAPPSDFDAEAQVNGRRTPVARRWLPLWRSR